MEFDDCPFGFDEKKSSNFVVIYKKFYDKFNVRNPEKSLFEIKI